MKLKVLIADDERLSRLRLREFLRAEPRIESVEECVSGTEALQALQERPLDLVFLDVKLPGLDGFGVLKALDPARVPEIIFVTAHDQFALQAFEINAVDYLLKPFNRPRLELALHRALQRLEGPGRTRNTAALAALMASATAQPNKFLDRLTIKSADRITLVNVEDIDWIRSADNYVEIHVGKTAHLLRMTLTSLAAQLNPDRFVRISRSGIVNSERVQEIRSKRHGDYLILLRDGTDLPGSRNYRHALARLLRRD